MSASNYTDLTRQGLWTNNPALVQVLGLCPLLAITSTAVSGLGLGLATMLTLVVSNGLISLIRNYTSPEIRIPVYVLVIACIVTSIELAINAYFHELYQILGIFIPLIVTNCIIIARAEAFASRNPVLPSLYDGFIMSLGFLAILVVLGMMREALGSGTLFANAHLMFGEAARGWSIAIEDYPGFLLAILPPGAFLALGLLIAANNWNKARAEQRTRAAVPVTA